MRDGDFYVVTDEESEHHGRVGKLSYCVECGRLRELRFSDESKRRGYVAVTFPEGSIRSVTEEVLENTEETPIYQPYQRKPFLQWFWGRIRAIWQP